MKGFGVFLLVVYPGAFVDVATDQLLSLSPWQQLRIFCAGVWHNIVIVILALLILISLPVLLSPFYSTGRSVAVTALTEVSTYSLGKGKGKVLYSLPSIGPGADPGIQAVSPQVTKSSPVVGCHYFPPGLRFTFVSIYQMAPPLTEVTDI